VVDMLAILIARAKEAGQVEGVIPHLIQDGLFILQYADDTVIFMSHDIQKVINMKLILTTFENYQGSRLTSKRVKSFALGRQKNMKSFIRNYSVVMSESILLAIWAYP